MSALRLLLLAEPDAAAHAMGPVRAQTEVRASLAPSPTVLANALRDESWDAVVIVPGGPILPAEIARCLAGHDVPLVVTGGIVPPELVSLVPLAIPHERMASLPDRLALRKMPASDAFVGAANAVFTAAAAANAAIPDVLAIATQRSKQDESERPVAFSPQAPAPPRKDRAAPEKPAAPPSAQRQQAPSRAKPTSPSHDAPAPELPSPEHKNGPSAVSVDVQRLAEQLPIGVYRTTPDGKFIYANAALAKVLRVKSVDQLAGLDVRSDLGYPREAFETQMEGGGVIQNMTVKWTHASGVTLWTRESARSVRDGLGRTLYYEGTMEDVTSEMHAHEAVAARSRQFEAIAHFAEEADRATSIQDVYQGAVAALKQATRADWALLVLHEDAGNRCAAWTGELPDEIAASIDADPDFKAAAPPTEPVIIWDPGTDASVWLPPSVRQELTPGGLETFSGFPLSRDGVTVGSLFSGHGASYAFTEADQQVAEALAWHLAGHLGRRDAEIGRKKSEEALGVLSDHTAQAIYRLRYADGGSLFEYMSPAIESLTGYAADSFGSADDLSAHLDRQETVEGDEDVPSRYVSRYRLRRHDGSHIWIENTAYPWRDQQGEPIGLVGVIEDITHVKERETFEAIESAEAGNRHVALLEFENMGGENAQAVMERAAEHACEVLGADDVSVYLAEGTAMRCSALHGPLRDAAFTRPDYPIDVFNRTLRLFSGEASVAFTDVEADERVQEAGLDAFVSDFGAAALLVAPIRRAGEAVGLIAIHRTDGPHEWTASDGELAGAVANAIAAAIGRDERAAAASALQASAIQFEELAGLASDYSFVVAVGADDAREVTWATPSFEHITGHAPSSASDKEGLLALVREDSKVTVIDALSELNESGETEFEAQIECRSGQAVWVRHRIRRTDTDESGAYTEYHVGIDNTAAKVFEEDILAIRAEVDLVRDAAETAVRRKNAFLADASHDLRTPLTAILGYADLLVDEVTDEKKEYVELIASAGQRLLETLDSVLDLSRVEAQGKRLNLYDVRVGVEVAQAVRLLAPLAEQRGLSLSVSVDPDSVARLDTASLSRIVNNLVGNAIKFTDEGGVEVSVDTDDDSVFLTVTDSGSGIDAAFLPHVFDEYRREERLASAGAPGSGLGLTITHRLVTLMGGSIDVRSNPPRGSAFTVSFPKAPSGKTKTSGYAGLAQNVHDTEPIGPMSEENVSEAAQAAQSADRTSEASSDSPPAPFPSDPAPGADSTATHDANPASPGPAAAPQSLTPDSVPSTSDTTDPASTAMFDFRFGSSNASDPSAPSSPQGDGFAEADADVQVHFTSPPPMMAPESDPVHAVVPSSQAAAVEEPTPIPVPAAASEFGFADVPVETVTAPQEPVMIVRAPRPEPPVKPPAQPQDKGDGGGIRPPVLVVEDNSDTRMLLERILKSTYDVTAVGDARSALLAMNQNQFRGLVLDINLGGKETGADVLRIARSLQGYDGVFAIALTAYALPGDRERLLEAGFDEYISKPFTRASLMDALAAGVKA